MALSSLPSGFLSSLLKAFYLESPSHYLGNPWAIPSDQRRARAEGLCRDHLPSLPYGEETQAGGFLNPFFSPTHFQQLSPHWPQFAYLLRSGKQAPFFQPENDPDKLGLQEGMLPHRSRGSQT